MNETFRFNGRKKRSSVLVLTLLIIVLVSVIVLGLLASVTLEKQYAESAYQQRRALEMSFMAYQNGVSQLRNALGTGTNSWDNPYANFCTNPPTFFWSVSPGIVTRWSYTSATALTNYPLFSYVNSSTTNLTVNLNRARADGSYPIIGGVNPPDVSVQFVNVLQDPTMAASGANPIIGRYAYWIDDENAKININVADGTQKYTTNSLGIGSLTEVSLQVLSQGGATLTQQLATNIVQMARTNSFHSPKEILNVPGTTQDLYTNNVFNITDYSRSPDLNVFGQPKMAMIPVLGSPNGSSDMVINGISLLPEMEIYPTPSQLPPAYVVSAAYGTEVPEPWPLAFRSQIAQSSMGDFFGQNHDIYIYATEPVYPYNNGSVIANYLAGTNTGLHPIIWPVFPVTTSPAVSTGTSGFAGKYTSRQLDEISIQAVSLGSKLISADYPNPLSTDFPNNNFPYFDISYYNGYGAITGSRYNNAPLMWPGWLSRQWVTGMGRAPKVTRLAMSLQTYGSSGAAAASTYNASYVPPYAYINVWLEEWVPGAYRGGKPVSFSGNDWALGSLGVPHYLNAVDIDNANGGATPTPAWLPKVPDVNLSTNSYWANQVLTNNQGIDFNNNFGDTFYDYTKPPYPLITTSYGDPDPVLATNWHNPWANYPDGSGTPYYHAAGAHQQYNHSFLYMNELENNSDANEWTPGTMRCVQSADNFPAYAPTKFFMREAASGQPLVIGGGLQALAQVGSGDNLGVPGNPDPVPLESMRGRDNAYPPLLTTDHMIDTDWLVTNATPGSPTSPVATTVRTRNIASVIPVALTNTVPAGTTSPIATASSVVTAYFTTQDPLVNKFPGDWTESTTLPTGFFNLSASADTGEVYASYSESTFLSTLSDPDSFWIPQQDTPLIYTSGVNTKTILATNTLIPRSARMPSIGYMQYIRTGIIPDDEKNVNYAQQKGTPYRLLSYAPLSDTTVPNSQQTSKTTLPASQAYPDWAMLDLFYVPSILYSFGGPYAGMTNLAPFGTYGGATAGRINPNGTVIYTTNVSVPRPDVTRLLPMEAALTNLYVSQHFTGSASTPAAWPYSGGSAVDAPTIAQAIATYIRANGPLRMPSEICNIPALAASPYRASANPTGSRNDLVRQVVGQLTTQSDTFSVWTVGQIIQKLPSNPTPGTFETGDLVLSEVRLHLIVERYLDPGNHSIYGNSSNPGSDNATNSFDDPVDPVYHPYEPRYLYRVVRSEEIR